MKNFDNNNITEMIIHADDFGASEEVTENIMDVYRDAKLTSVSVLVNGCDFERAMTVLKDNHALLYSIHFNITEGHCISDRMSIPLLVNEKGMFDKSFFSILVKSMLPGSKRLKSQIKMELSSQLEKFLKKEDELGIAKSVVSNDGVAMRTIRVDSHQHFHMIPVVLKCILEICKEREIEIEFLRIPSEPLGPILRRPGLWHTYRPINLVKNRVLATLAVVNHKRLRPFYADGKSAIFFGMIMSCEMDKDRANKLLPDFTNIANKKKRRLEILAHPGRCTNEEDLMDKENELCKEFYMSKKRLVEKEFLMSVKV